MTFLFCIYNESEDRKTIGKGKIKNAKDKRQDMKERKFYKGKLDGKAGVWCDKCPKGLKDKVESVFYSADEGKVLVKDGKMVTSVVLKEGEKITDWQEVEAPKEEDV